VALHMLAFGSVYVYEQKCSIMNINKACCRSKVPGQNLRCILRIASKSWFQTLMHWLKS